jgi:hypothetical protein
MRLVLALLLATPAHAWEFSATSLCTLSHETENVEVTITYDPAQPLYTLTLTGPDWPEAPGFALDFAGGYPLTLRTVDDRREDGALVVTDTGFGNVLDGLEFNSLMTAIAGITAVAVPLDGAAEAVQAFRDCPAPVTS